MSTSLALSARRLRFEFMTVLMDRPAPPTVLDAMLMTDAMVDYVERGEIKGLSPGIQPERKPARRSATA
jgi:hypothetical protein